MRILAAAALFVLLALRGCVRYEFDHELWLNVDGSGEVRVTGRPELWSAFKGLSPSSDPETLRGEARRLFEASGLEVRRVTLTRRRGQPYLFVAARFDDVNRLEGTAAFPDLRLKLRREGDRLRLAGMWKRPAGSAADPPGEGLVAVRFHVPSKIYEHKNAAGGVERGNILSWRETVAEALSGRALDLEFLVDERSILFSTVGLFAATIGAAFAILAAGVYLTARRGRRRAR